MILLCIFISNFITSKTRREDTEIQVFIINMNKIILRNRIINCLIVECVFF